MPPRAFEVYPVLAWRLEREAREVSRRLRALKALMGYFPDEGKLDLDLAEAYLEEKKPVRSLFLMSNAFDVPCDLLDLPDRNATLGAKALKYRIRSNSLSASDRKRLLLVSARALVASDRAKQAKLFVDEWRQRSGEADEAVLTLERKIEADLRAGGEAFKSIDFGKGLLGGRR